MHLNGSAGTRFIPRLSQYLDLGTAGNYVGAWHMFSGRVSSGNGTVRVDKVDGGSGTSSQSTATTALLLGERKNGTYPLVGDIAEVIIFNRALTTAERVRVEGYLSGKYATGTSPVTSDFGYAGYYNHTPSNLNLTQYRAYDPNTAKWLSRDPIAERGGINLYGFVGNNPIDKIDPLGLNPGDILPSGGGIQITGTVDVGIPTPNGMVMAGGTGSLGLGNFYNSTTGQSSTGTFNSAGAFQHLPGVPPSNYPSSGGYSQCPQTPFAAGAHAGFGPGVFLTNAGNVNDLSGPFNQYNLNLIGINISLGLAQDANGNTTYILGVSLPNAGLALSGYPTTTTVLSNSAPPGPTPRP